MKINSVVDHFNCQAFEQFDADGDGYITKEELHNLVMKFGGKLSEGEATALIRQVFKFQITIHSIH